MTEKFVTLPRELVEQALNAFETEDWQKKLQAAIALRAALEQPQGEQEPFAWINPRALEWGTRQSEKVVKLTCKAQPEYDFTEPLYTHPQPKREPLTDDVIADLMMRTWGCASIAPRHAPTFARAIEAAHNIK